MPETPQSSSSPPRDAPLDSSSVPLSARAEATLNRDRSRRRANISAAGQTKGGWDKRRAALQQQLDLLTKQAEKADRAVTENANSLASVRSTLAEEEQALSKVQASAAMMDKLHEQLHQRKAEILEQRSAILAEDERLRGELSETLKTRVAAFDQARNDTRNPGAAADGDPSNPFDEHSRLRAQLRHSTALSLPTLV